MEHLSADRLGDMVDAVRSNPPDLATLPRTHAAFLESPPVEFAPPPPPPPPAYETPPAPAVESPVEVEPDYTWADAVPPPVLPAEDIAALPRDIPIRDFEIPGVPEPAPQSRVAKRKRGGLHRRPPSLRHFARGLARSLRAILFTRRLAALLGIIGLLIVATALLGVN